MFFPFQFEHPVHGRGWLTIAVILLCIGVYIYQYSDDKSYEQSIQNFCERQVGQDSGYTRQCMELVAIYHYSQMSLDEYLSRTGAVANTESLNSASLVPLLEQYEIQHPISSLGAFHPQRPMSFTVFTAVVMHGDIWHLFFNLVFFYSFSRVAEELLGFFGYLGLLLGSAIAIAWILKSGSFGFPTDRPTLGLSGIVFSVMACVSTVIPQGMVRVVYWFVVVFGYFRVPALVLVLGYVAVNYYDLLAGSSNDVNYLAHIGGAISGAVFAMLYLFIGYAKNHLRRH